MTSVFGRILHPQITGGTRKYFYTRARVPLSSLEMSTEGFGITPWPAPCLQCKQTINSAVKHFGGFKDLIYNQVWSLKSELYSWKRTPKRDECMLLARILLTSHWSGTHPSYLDTPGACLLTSAMQVDGSGVCSGVLLMWLALGDGWPVSAVFQVCGRASVQRDCMSFECICSLGEVCTGTQMSLQEQCWPLRVLTQSLWPSQMHSLSTAWHWKWV